jgi:hypothetical protein
LVLDCLGEWKNKSFMIRIWLDEDFVMIPDVFPMNLNWYKTIQRRNVCLGCLRTDSRSSTV